MSPGTSAPIYLLGFAAGNLAGPLLDQLYDTIGSKPMIASIRYVIGGTIMVAGGIVEVLLGVSAEGRQLEQVACPLSAIAATQVPRRPLPGAHYSPAPSRPDSPQPPPDAGPGYQARVTEHGHYRLEGRWRDSEVEQPPGRSADLLFRPLDGRGQRGGSGWRSTGERKPALERPPGLAGGLADPGFGDRLTGEFAEPLIGQAPAGPSP
jgi:hypothetical protein